MDRLVFGNGTSRHAGEAAAPPAALNDALPLLSPPARADWGFLGLMVFTGLLFFRPQDFVTPLRSLHLAEIAAVIALGSLVTGRLSRGLSVTRFTPELTAVLALAAVILLTAPFSIWMGGVIGTFTGQYAKVVLIFVLMVNTLTSPKRIKQFTFLIVMASGYIASRAVMDYARGINLIENGRVQGAVGGMFRNPNDLALNMVAVLPLAVFVVLQPVSAIKRGFAALAGVAMIGTVIASQSRSGTIGLAAMVLVLGAHIVRRRPGLVLGLVLAGVLALPALPSSYWQRLASITDKDLDQTGSREARSILLKESFDAFLAHPFTGVGAGQFKNYNPEGRQEAWRESHNAVLQVASELGILGLIVFGYLLTRAMSAPIHTRRLIRAATPGRRGARGGPEAPPLGVEEQDMLAMHAAAMSAALAGWFVCALFASVAYHWTFYYLLALATAPRDYLLARVAGARSAKRAAAARTVEAAAATT